MGGKAAVDGDAEEALLDAQVLVACEQSRHWPQPIQGKTAAPPISSFGVGSDFIDDAGDLVAEREGQRHAARGVELLAAAEIGIAVLDVQVGMAQTARSMRTSTSRPCGFGCR